MPIPVTEIKAICEVYDADLTDFEKILKIEQTAFPLIQEKHKEQQDNKD